MNSIKDDLEKKGWQRQFTYDEPRLSEAVELYKELGYEVHLEDPTEEDVLGNCGVCFEGSMDKYKTIYTRMKTDDEVNK